MRIHWVLLLRFLSISWWCYLADAATVQPPASWPFVSRTADPDDDGSDAAINGNVEPDADAGSDTGTGADCPDPTINCNIEPEAQFWADADESQEINFQQSMSKVYIWVPSVPVIFRILNQFSSTWLHRALQTLATVASRGRLRGRMWTLSSMQTLNADRIKHIGSVRSDTPAAGDRLPSGCEALEAWET